LYLGGFNTNYILFRNAEIFNNFFPERQSFKGRTLKILVKHAGGFYFLEMQSSNLIDYLRTEETY
jgi:hypothetical protein